MNVLLANITWNPTGWRNTYQNPKAGHKYAKEYVGHESLNFKFDKKGLDKGDSIYGFVQWTNAPVNFENGGVIIFYSKNLDKNKGEIVGIYGNVEILENPKIIPYQGFKENELTCNIKANKNLSMLFPIALDSKNYSIQRSVPQVGFTYKDNEYAENIIRDEINELQKSGIKIEELTKLMSIYKYVTGYDFQLENVFRNDSLEQDELVKIINREYDKTSIIDELNSLQPTEPELIITNNKSYRRNNKTIAQLKIIRNFSCQICSYKILKKTGDFYIEAAHIKPKKDKGTELPDNILILCPNHHKEFDYGEKRIIKHNKELIVFELNGNKYNIDLLIK